MLVNIQFLRFIAATLLVFYHAAAKHNATGADSALFAFLESFGFAGVDIFFVISGFIMFHTTQNTQGLAAGSRFLRRRIARIYSGYWPFFLLALLVLAWTNPDRFDVVDIAGSALLWPVPRLVLPVSWTLIFEMYFYVCFAVLLIIKPAARPRVLMFTLLVVAAWVTWAHFGRQAYSPDNLLSLKVYEYYFAGPYLMEFLAGALAGFWLKDQAKHRGWLWLGLGVTWFVAGGWVNNEFFDTRIEQGYTMYYRVLLFGPPSVMILAGLVKLEHRGIKAPIRFSLIAGGASYAIYLSHTLILSVAVELGMITALKGQPTSLVVFSFCVLIGFTLLASILYFQFIERRLHRSFMKALRV